MGSDSIKGMLEEKIPAVFRSSDLAEVIVFGAGGDGVRTQKMLKRLGIRVVKFCDNNSRKWTRGGVFSDNIMECISPDELYKQTDIPVVIGTENYMGPISRQLSEHKNICYTTGRAILFWRECEKLERVYSELLTDEESRRIYRTLIEILVTGNTDLIAGIHSRDQYFAIPEFAIHKINDFFVDCGGSVGDSIEQFLYMRLGAFKQIYSFEPMSVPYRAMQKRVERLEKEWAVDEGRIHCLNMGVADETADFYFNPSGVLEETFVRENPSDTPLEKYPFVCLDDFFRDRTSKITFIKADIETFEMRMLSGARQIITTDAPNMAICIYHRFEDLYEVPLKIHDIYPDYRMQVRHHGFNLWETVMYCYVQ